MTGLALALLWTPLGISALAAAAAAVLAILYLRRAALPLIALAVVLTAAAYISFLQADLLTARRERDDARAQVEAGKLAVAALERDAKATAKRTGATMAARERIVRAPTSADGPLARVLRDELEADR